MEINEVREKLVNIVDFIREKMNIDDSEKQVHIKSINQLLRDINQLNPYTINGDLKVKLPAPEYNSLKDI